MTRAYVGETRLPKNFKRYARQFSLLELDCEPGSVPGRARLEACAAAAPDGFVFSLVVPSRIASLETGPDIEKAWKAAQNVARVLRAKWWVVRTPAEVRPTRRARERLAALVARLQEGGMRVAWEPRGVWDEAAAAETANAIGAVFIQDIAREAPVPGRVLYSRLLAFGKGGRVGLSLADVVADRLRAYDEAFVVVEGQGAREIQQALGMALAEDALLDDEADAGEIAPAGEGAEAADEDDDDGDDDAIEDDADDVDEDDDDEQEDEPS